MNIFETINLNMIKENAFRILIAFVIFKIAKYLKKNFNNLIKTMFEKAKTDKSIASFLYSIYSISYYFVLIYLLILLFGINPKSITTFIGAVGIALGIAFKEILGNFGSGFMILLFKPFKIGDMIEFKDYIGEVISIELFYTKIKTPQNEMVIFPNALITNNELRNISRQKVRRLDLQIGVSYKSDIKKTKKIIENVVKENSIIKGISKIENIEQEKYILRDPKPIIGVGELGDSAIIFNVYVYVRSENFLATKLKLNEELKIKFDEVGIEIPYPQLDLHIKKVRSNV